MADDPRGEPGPVLGTGRGATVYDIGSGKVLRRYRTARDMTREAEAMRWVRVHGVPVPEVFDVDGADIVMERIEGPSLLSGLVTHPYRLPGVGRILAELHAKLDAVPVPEWLEVRYPAATPDVRLGVVHGDLHPDNVMMSADGPVLIDWTNACAGDRGADLAQTWIIVAHFGRPDGGVTGVVEGFARRVLLRSFLSRIDRARAESWLARIATKRLDDPNLKDSERQRLRERVINVP